MSQEPELEAWERRPGESEPAYAAFVVYRNQPAGERSIRKAATAIGKDWTLLGRWSSTWSWPARVAAWDREQDLAYQRELAKERKDMAKRHANLAVLSQQKVFEALQGLDAADITPRDLPRLLDVAVKIERLSRGANDSSIELTGAGGGPLKLAPEVSPQFVADVLSRLGQSDDPPADEDPE